jgi:hypothetical protein
MSADSIAKAREFVDEVPLPEPPIPDFAATRAAVVPFDFKEIKDQAAVVGSDVISFVKGVTAQRRQDVVNAALLAQLVAKKKVPQPASMRQIEAWYNEYFDALSNIGFAVQDKGFVQYQEKGQSFEVHEAILEVAAMLLAGSPGAIALVNTTLKALQKMSTDSPWITLFNRESQTAKAARFQVSLVERDRQAGFLLSMLAFGLEARSNLTQVLFFKFHSEDVKLFHQSGKVTINDRVLTAVREPIAQKLIAFANDYVKGLPDL